MAQEALEALQLEKRLSLLSHSGRPGSGGSAVTRLRSGEIWRPWGWGRSFKLPFLPPVPTSSPPHSPAHNGATLTQLQPGCRLGCGAAAESAGGLGLNSFPPTRDTEHGCTICAQSGDPRCQLLGAEPPHPAPAAVVHGERDRRG